MNNQFRPGDIYETIEPSGCISVQYFSQLENDKPKFVYHKSHVGKSGYGNTPVSWRYIGQ